ncbi:signal transducer and transcription activator-like [Ylistrum balloti]|uniref:signal transducer and transcription activator-like n=1 Tax=Ylistrum balloti TaxID=509963 RepID=UPI0029058591|nr:signal transducer and transcription activator-like [Ylistrum balloti]
MADAEPGEIDGIMSWNAIMEHMKTDQGLQKKWTDLYSYKEEIKKLRLRCEHFLTEDRTWNQALESFADKSWQTNGETSEMLYQQLIKCYEDKCNQNTADGIIISGELNTLQSKYEGKHCDLVTDLLRCLDEEKQLLLTGGQEDMDTTEKDGILHNVRMLDVNCKKILETLVEIVKNAGEVLEEMKAEVKCWKEEQTKYYVDVASQPTMPSKPPLTKWCAHAGSCLFDLIRCTLPNVPVYDSPDLTQKIQDINNIFDQMLQCSFLVTNQVKNFIKVSMGTKKKSVNGQDEEDEEGEGNKKFSCPKFKATVRLLAAASIDSLKPVQAYFVHEDTLSQVIDPATHDFTKSKYPLKDNKQKGSSSTATVEKDTGIATFKSLELKSFNREKESNVAKEKFRLVFQTRMIVGERHINLWTMSLPIVVITGASQQCNACGSLLWQCLNPADEGQFPPPACPEDLPWSQVKELLDTKIKYLGGRGLTLEEEKHLICRITGDQNASVDKDPMISFRKFCIDKMMDISDPHKKAEERKKSATFWMWFQAVYNLISTYLKEYWRRELILGFLDKDQAEYCLKDSKPNTFLLRFSNKIITDAQGQNMCGAVSVSYRTAAGKIDHMVPSDAEVLKKCNLAQMLKKMINCQTLECEMKWVYPMMHDREEVYKDFLEADSAEGKHTDGYTKLKEILFVDPVNEVTNHFGNLTTAGRPKKRPVHRVKCQAGNSSNSKVAKVNAVRHSAPDQSTEQILDQEIMSRQQSGNLPTLVCEREASMQQSNSSMQRLLPGRTTSRTRSEPHVPDVMTKQKSSITSSQSHSFSPSYPLLQTMLSEKVKDGLKLKLTQGEVEVNKNISWSQAEDRMDMIHKQKKTIIGGNNGFIPVETKVRLSDSPAALLPMPQGSLKQSGSPQTETLVDPKVESQLPSQNALSTVQEIIVSQDDTQMLFTLTPLIPCGPSLPSVSTNTELISEQQFQTQIPFFEEPQLNLHQNFNGEENTQDDQPLPDLYDGCNGNFDLLEYLESPEHDNAEINETMQQTFNEMGSSGM